ncbi:MAG TPA: hypothetical protein VMF08_23995 [Candidatus Sulfotelmatobacter sp.]|nr:hypothetical protein [Candidatus Sulfotelmatobacter sp.]
MKQTISIVLNLFLCVFVASGVLSVVDDSLRLFWGFPFLMAISAILSCIAFLFAIVVYGLMGLTPMIPKRVFLPVTLFYAAGIMVTVPVMIYGGGDWVRRSLQLDWANSLCQAILGLAILCWLRGGWKFRWPLVPDEYLGHRRFSWVNLCLFALANVLVGLPVVAAYFFLCGAMAVGHFTAGFLTVRPGGLTSQVRQYARSDGREIELVPMAHIGDADFYQKISESFPTNSIVLMEGVTDEKNLLKHGISYKRMAKTLGVSEQMEEFKPRGELVMADVDVDQFSTNTLDLLNIAMLIHADGVNVDTLMKLAQYSAPTNLDQESWTI